MTIKNREQFLNNVAEHLGRSRRTTGVERPTWTVQPQHDVHKDASLDELVDLLEKQCAAIHTDFKRTTKEHLPHVLRATMEAYQVKTVITPVDKRNETYGLTSFYEQVAQEQIDVRLWDPKKGKINIAFAERADVGITFSDLTLAESATVTLFNNQHHSRSLSLLPKSYIAIIPKKTIVPRLTQAMQLIHEENKQGRPVSSCVSFVSGPSNSADIEMNLIVGVHGPVQATYILVED